MEFEYLIKCVFISEKHVSFNVTVHRSKSEKKIAEGNVMVNRFLEINGNFIMDKEIESIWENMRNEINNLCVDKAKWIFNID